MELVIDHLLRLNPDRPQDALVNSALTITAAEAIRIEPLPLTRLAAPIHRQRCFSEILVRGDFGCGSSFGFFTA